MQIYVCTQQASTLLFYKQKQKVPNVKDGGLGSNTTSFSLLPTTANFFLGLFNQQSTPLSNFFLVSPKIKITFKVAIVTCMKFIYLSWYYSLQGICEILQQSQRLVITSASSDLEEQQHLKLLIQFLHPVYQYQKLAKAYKSVILLS